MKNLYSVFLSLIVVPFALGQNLVPNGSFENYKKCPKALGQFFATSWYSPSKTTPDLFSNCAGPGETTNPGSTICQVKPYGGDAFAAIIVAENESTWREYLAVPLNEALIADTTYLFEISVAVSHMSRYIIQSLDIVFSSEKIEEGSSTKILELKPDFSLDMQHIKTDGSWTRLSIEYLAKGGERLLHIGNFKSIKETKLIGIKGRNKGTYKTLYDYAHLCIDGVRLTSLYGSEEMPVVEPVKPVEVKKQPEAKPIVETKAIAAVAVDWVVEGITFKTASAEIESTNMPELDKIVKILNENPTLSLEIAGHTDDTGNEANNVQLSQQRAASVRSYLIAHGIDSKRLSAIGKGSSQPAADNDTEAGRAMNRRIEVVLKQ